MQTILENLEETYLQLEQVLEDDKAGRIQLDTADREAIHIAFTNTIKNLVLLIIDKPSETTPQDVRVYKTLVKTPTFAELHEEWKNNFIQRMYEECIFTEEFTVGSLIKRLQDFDEDVVIRIEGHKFKVDLSHYNSINFKVAEV